MVVDLSCLSPFHPLGLLTQLWVGLSTHSSCPLCCCQEPHRRHPGLPLRISSVSSGTLATISSWISVAEYPGLSAFLYFSSRYPTLASFVAQRLLSLAPMVSNLSPRVALGAQMSVRVLATSSPDLRLGTDFDGRTRETCLRKVLVAAPSRGVNRWQVLGSRGSWSDSEVRPRDCPRSVLSGNQMAIVPFLSTSFPPNSSSPQSGRHDVFSRISILGAAWSSMSPGTASQTKLNCDVGLLGDFDYTLLRLPWRSHLLMSTSQYSLLGYGFLRHSFQLVVCRLTHVVRSTSSIGRNHDLRLPTLSSE
ncbi:hypothetical protein JAAARDRAFT_608064 [Jaapia argillacea MUCL 33604]|uniref:Uncharacterized protein n=1 Tax=Jaapia argillacea MUCL 33604 TaxID=933084 RepID=A0A067Q0A5_9AGAM|nr:hypothetical protein JAAARDRAFT_608064 [Jaapia argillacea MUCL 33604]